MKIVHRFLHHYFAISLIASVKAVGEQWKEEEWDGDDSWRTTDAIWDNLGCEDIFSTERPIHSQQKWEQAIDIYHAIIQDSRLDPLKNGFSVGIEAKQTEGKGRGIYATHPIKKGELVWSSKRTARFDDGDDYRHFLSVLDVDFACDVLQWAYVQDVSDSDEHQELQISVDLDEGCFCNGEGDGEPSSVGCDEDEAVNFEGGCRSNYFALRDIEAGEELLCNYDEFALPYGWKEFGLDLPNSMGQKYWFAGDFNANGWDGSLDYEEKDWDGIWSVNKIWYNLGCPHIFSTERPIHSQQKWKQAIDIFHAIVGDGHLDPLKNGFSVGIEAKQTEGKGRGIYATHPIKNGELVWSSKRTAMFDDGDDYRHFLSVLDVEFACEALQCSYVQDVSDSDEHQELRISVDLDEGCFCNTEAFDANVGCDEDEAVNFEGGCRSNYFALRDIEAGEEFICNYSEFALPDGWTEFGLL